MSIDREPAAAGEAIFGRMGAVAEPLRARLLLVLEGRDLTVTELCSIFQLPQSTMSRHLKALVDEGWLESWTEGRSTRHRLEVERLDAATRGLWEVVKRQTAGLAAAEQDAGRVRSVLAQRRTRSQEFFSSAAGEWDRVRAELFGRRADLLALLALLDEGWVVGDLGSGTGQVTEPLSRFVGRVIAVDESAEMLAAARERLTGAANVEIRRGSLESLPIGDGELDAAVIVLVLHYVEAPARALREASRALREGGRLLVVDMMPHDRSEYRQRMGHVWQGFAEEQIGGWMREAGLESVRYTPLPADPEAKGPALFAATARKVDQAPGG